MKSRLISTKNDLTIQDYQNLLTNLPKSVRQIEIVGGGEPLLFHQIIPLLISIKNEHYYGSLITNGSLLNQKLINHLIKYKWDMVRISFHAASAKTYQKIQGVDHYKTVIKNIRLFLKLRSQSRLPKLKLLFVIQKDNYHEIKAFIELCQKLKVDQLEFDYLIADSPKAIISQS